MRIPRRRSLSVTFHPVLAVAIVAVGSLGQSAQPISPASKTVRDAINLHAPDGCRHINGFNYQPSWGHDGLSVWGEKFDPKRYREELATGKELFPKFNAVRIWLSWSAYRANPERFIRNFQQAVDICGELDLLVLPVVFNRWTGRPLWDRVQNTEILADFDATFEPYIKALVEPHKGDLRILAWDLCNEPYLAGAGDEAAPVSLDVETQWLTKVREAVKRRDPAAWICVGTCPAIDHLKRASRLEDILTPHLYYPLYAFPPAETPSKLQDSQVPPNVIDESFAVAKELNRPMISSECCWGSMDDAERAFIVRANLEALRKHGIAFFPHALWTSGVADLHKYKEGLYMPFILEDGSLRPGHGVYNEFAK